MNRLLKVSVSVFVSALFVMAAFGSANAIPAFSKKYAEACDFCHTVWPQLNRWGEDFKLNGYQAPKTMDGSTKNKNAQTHAWLNTGDANPPISIRMHVKTNLYQQDTAEADGSFESRRSFLNENKADLNIFVGGTFTKNVGYFAEYDGAGGLDQGFVTLNNIFGPGMLNVETGISNLNQFGVVTKHRNVIKVQKIVQAESTIAYDSDPNTTGNQGPGKKLLNDNGDAPTIQVFGNPARGAFTYSLGIANNNDDNTGAKDDFSTGGMLRWDFRAINVAVSYNFDFGSQHSGASDSAGNQYFYHLLGVKYEGSNMNGRAWYGYATQDNYTFVTSNEVENKRSGFGVDGWYIWKSFEFGAGLDVNSESVSGPSGVALWTDKNKSAQTSLSYLKFALEANYALAQNARMGLLFEFGGYEKEYLEAAGGFTDDAIMLTADVAF